MINKHPHILLFVFLALVSVTKAQEIQTFTLADFDLRNNVKFCLVSTDYGKEEYDFNKKGLLTKSVTRYNDSDYDIVFYKYTNGELTEKRSESYRDNSFDASTSIAHFYQIDTTENLKIQERIFSYDKEFLEEYVYTYDASGDLSQIRRTNKEGTDITQVEHKKYNGEYTVTYSMNEVPLKSVRTSIVKPKNKPAQEVVLTKKFLNGQQYDAFEEVFSMDGKLLVQQEFKYNAVEQKFVPTVRTSYTYDEKGMLIGEVAKAENQIKRKEYIYQYDKQEDGNWIKQIVVPDNTYTTRKIVYYDPVKKVAE